MYIAVAFIHVIVSLFLIIVVLLQSGKAADLAGAFGGLGSQTVFGPRGSATVLTRATTISAIVFMVTSLTLSILSTGSSAGGGTGGGVLDSITAPVQETDAPTSAAPAAPNPANENGTGYMEVTTTGPDGKPVTKQVPLPPATKAGEEQGK